MGFHCVPSSIITFIGCNPGISLASGDPKRPIALDVGADLFSTLLLRQAP